jgi:hypothetical protein
VRSPPGPPRTRSAMRAFKSHCRAERNSGALGSFRRLSGVQREVAVTPEHATDGLRSSGCDLAPAAVAARDWIVVQEPALVGQNDGLDAVAKAELGEDVRDVRLDRCLADEELLTDLGI